jgi:prepilin-type N-terminal cleavage/methylation domain-containing protein
MRQAAAQRGFTLLEVLLCLAIILMLGGSVMGFMLGLLERREAITGAAAQQAGAAALLERIEADLSCGIAGDSQAGAGIHGTSERLVLLTRGVWLPDHSRPEAAMGDLQGSEYVLEGNAVLARRWAAGDEDAGELEVICGGVERLRLRYFDGEGWQASFDSQARGGLPVAVEVALWFRQPGTSTEPVLEEPGRFMEEDPDSVLPPRDPDRVRLVIVPDGPVAAWKEGR